MINIKEQPASLVMAVVNMEADLQTLVEMLLLSTLFVGF